MIPMEDAFHAIRDGTFRDFKKHYRHDPNEFSKTLRLPLLMMTVVNDDHPDDKLQIMRFLIDAGADVNVTVPGHGWNVLSLFYTNVPRVDIGYAMKVTSLFLAAGVDVNHRDRAGATPLAAAVSCLRASNDVLLPLVRLLLDGGANPRIKDEYQDDSIAYAKKFPWRVDLVPVLEAVHV